MQKNPQAIRRLESIDQKLDHLNNRIDDIYTLYQGDLELGQPLLPKKDYVIDIHDDVHVIQTTIQELVDPFSDKSISLAGLGNRISEILNYMKIADKSDQFHEFHDRLMVMEDRLAVIQHNTTAISNRLELLFGKLFPLGDREWEAVGPLIFE